MDWSADVCSSDLVRLVQRLQQLRVVGGRAVRGPALGLVERGGKLVDVSAGAVLAQLQVRLREQGLLLAKASAQAFEQCRYPGRRLDPVVVREPARHGAADEAAGRPPAAEPVRLDLRPGRRPRSEEHTSELQSLRRTSYAFFCLK